MNELWMRRGICVLGLLVFLGIAWLASTDRRRMNWRLIGSGVLIQLLLGVFLLRTIPGRKVYDAGSNMLSLLVDASNHGSSFLFGEELVSKCPALGFLPAIIVVSSLTAVLFHLGVLQKIVWLMSKIMVRVMDVSGSESLAASANIFVGMTEAPLVVKPYLKTMTRSELMAMMTGGMATSAGGTMAIYAFILKEHGVNPGHLLTASLMSAPASLVLAKILVPETEHSLTKGEVSIDIPRKDANVIDAACRGASEGMKLALNVAAMLIAFIALIWLVNQGVGWALPDVGGEPMSLQRVLGWAFAPLAWLMGIPWSESLLVGQFLGEKTILNEIIAYQDMAEHSSELSERSKIIVSYALCGFANFGSVAIMIGGIGGLAPERRKEMAELGMRALLGGTLAAMMTANIAALMI